MALKNWARLDRSMLARGLNAAGQVSGAATELVRTRRDPSLLALRRREAARRRAATWGTVGGAAVLATAGSVLAILTQGLSAMLGFYLVLAVAFLVWSGSGLIRALRDLRERNRAVASLPPPQPARVMVTSAIRPEIERLGRFSDSLRQLVAMIGIVDDPSILAVRQDVLAAADAAEIALRQRAKELTGVVRARRAGPPAAVSGLNVTAQDLTQEIKTGVDEYGRLVAAASETVAASREWSPTVHGLAESTDRLRALAAGMRELSGL